MKPLSPPFTLAQNLKFALPALLWLAPFSLVAQTLPDAGRLLREQPKAPPILPAAPQPKLQPKAPDQEAAKSGSTVLVKAFRIEGATLIPVEELQSQVQSAIGKELSVFQLRGVANMLVAYFAQKGFLAQALIPPQDVNQGVVLIKIVEGKRGSLEINNQGQRVKTARVQGFIDHRLAQGDFMNLNALGESITLLNEQPGVDVKATLKPGSAAGQTGLVVNAADRPLTSFNLGLSNNGSRGTGEIQALGSATLNNPLGWFDAATLMVVKSDGSSFGLLSYSLAVGDSGLRLGASASDLRYTVTQSSLRATDAHGTADTAGLNGMYPLYRLANVSLNLSANLDTKHLHDFTVAGETDHRRVDTSTLGLDGTLLDGLGGGGATTFGVAYVNGQSHESNAAAIAADDASRQSLGGFSKLKFKLERQQKLQGSWELSAKLRGQFAFDNLDSSERFSLGGADGIRAYPAGEAGADEGWLLSLDFSRPINDKLRGSVFLDTGHVQVNHTTWTGWDAGNPNLRNQYQLSGVGVGLDWKLNQNFALTATVATKLGSNPGRSVTGDDTDGTHQNVRAWVNLVGQF